MDVFDSKKRSEVMSRIKGKDTKPEHRVRSYLHAAGLRYRIHDKRLPGKPDLVFPALRTVIFVHGCFWHGHPGCSKATVPKTRTEFWREKIEGNRARDERHERELRDRGWDVLTIWACEINAGKLAHLAECLKARRNGKRAAAP